MGRIFVFLCLFLVISFANAQDSTNSEVVINHIQIADEEDELQWFQNRIGLYGSFFSGYGLSYQYQFENDFSLKTQFFTFFLNDEDNKDIDDNTYQFQFVYGADLQYNLFKTKNTRIYALVGSYIGYFEYGDNHLKLKNSKIERLIKSGVGFGIELMGGRNFSLILELGYHVNYGNKNVTSFRTEDKQDVKYIDKQITKSNNNAAGIGVFYAF